VRFIDRPNISFQLLMTDTDLHSLFQIAPTHARTLLPYLHKSLAVHESGTSKKLALRRSPTRFYSNINHFSKDFGGRRMLGKGVSLERTIKMGMQLSD
jgi:hypothetical protein